MLSKLHRSCHSYDETMSFSSRADQPQPLNVTVYFTEDLIAEILSRLPVKILLRFRCVSKPWCSLIDSPRFVKTHLNRSIQCKTNLGIIVRSFISYSVDFDSLENATTAIEIDEPLKTFLHGTGVVGSCNGLHCLYNFQTDIFLWNPATRKCRMIPTAPTEFLRRPFELDRSSLCGFGYDAVNDDYKVLRILQPDSNDLSCSKVTIYSLKMNSWKPVQNISRQFRFWGTWGIYFNGALHWIAIKCLGFETTITILAFDLGFENYREVPKPKVQKNFVGDMSILKFAESLCFLEFYPDRIDVWAMNDPGMGNTWGKLFAVEQPKVTRSCMSVRPIVYSKCRKNVLLEVDSEMVMWYNLESKKVKTVEIANLPYTFDFDVYTESLVSPEYNSSCDTQQLQKQPLEKKKQQQQQQQQQKRNKSKDKFLSKGFKLVL